MKGYVQQAFERRVGMEMSDWMREHGGHMTCTAAAEEIGYKHPTGLKGWVNNNMPGFKFYARAPFWSDENLYKAIQLRATGRAWRVIARHLGGDHLSLRDACRHYQKSKGANP